MSFSFFFASLFSVKSAIAYTRQVIEHCQLLHYRLGLSIIKPEKTMLTNASPLSLSIFPSAYRTPNSPRFLSYCYWEIYHLIILLSMQNKKIEGSVIFIVKPQLLPGHKLVYLTLPIDPIRL
jgi:hypothetical protein